MWGGPAGKGVPAKMAFSLALRSAWNADFHALSRIWDDAVGGQWNMRGVAEDQMENVLEARYRIQRKEKEIAYGEYLYPLPLDELRDKITANISRDMFFLSGPEPTSAHFANKYSLAAARSVHRRYKRACAKLLQRTAGTGGVKEITPSYGELMKKVAELQLARVAVYQPRRVQRHLTLPLQEEERMISL
jgi:hypothetical protein